MVRIFLALKLSTEIRKTVTESISQWQKISGSKVRWIPSENLHITLKFIGEVDDAKIHSMENRCLSVCSKKEPVALLLDSTGFFPGFKRPRILWVGLKDQANNLEMLSKDLDISLSTLGIPMEKRRFYPHITVARIKSPIHLENDFKKHFQETTFPKLSMSIHEVTLFKSELLRSGARYVELHNFKLGT